FFFSFLLSLCSCRPFRSSSSSVRRLPASAAHLSEPAAVCRPPFFSLLFVRFPLALEVARGIRRFLPFARGVDLNKDHPEEDEKPCHSGIFPQSYLLHTLEPDSETDSRTNPPQEEGNDEPPVPWTRPDLPLTRSQVKAFKTRVTAYIGDWSRAKHEELDQRFIREGCTVLTLDDRQKINNEGKCPKDTARAPADTANQPLPRLTQLHTQNLADKLKPEGSEGQKTWREPHLSEEKSSRKPEQPGITKTLAPGPERMMLGRSSEPKDVTRPPGHPEPAVITEMPPRRFQALFLAASGFLPAPGGFPFPPGQGKPDLP
ncbi:hypothetical protein LINPERPRIM_LOCUS4932, partial [Linum perenne]